MLKIKPYIKYIPYILLILIGLYVADLLKSKKRLHEDLIGTTQKFQKLSEYSANLERKYVTQEELLKEVEKNWSKEKEALTGRIKLLSNATYLIREKARQSNQSDLVYKGDRLKYVVNEIRFNDGPAVGYVLIFDDGKVVSKIYNHVIDVKTAVARNEVNGKYDVLSKADYILKSPSLSTTGEWFNKPYPLKINGGTALIDPTEPVNQVKSFYYWAPSLNANVNFSSEISPGLGVSLMGYGYSKRDLDFKFIQLGFDYSERRDLGLTLTPVLYRPLPNVFSNTYIGPGMSIDSIGYRYFLGVQVSF